MYEVPELYLTQDYLQAVNLDDVQNCKLSCTERSLFTCDNDVYDLCLQIMNERHIAWSRDPYDRVNLFMELKDSITAAL